MQTEHIQLNIQIGHEANSGIIELKPGFIEDYDIDTSQSINLELAFDDGYLAATWVNTGGAYCTATNDDPDVIDTVCSNPEIGVLAVITTAIDNDDYECEADDEPEPSSSSFTI
ncbi:hypothetical protein ACFSE0_12505 [Ochrobactrum teleogrylli]|uniref:Ig-like domain-containing protein n=1 Tax=Ochrobactrum teleogrylli TaxID=2479765 RepID=A0ABY2Y3G0_9HYPH|nr:hypothetical protein [[Ochrobactrum] teleogrylli]TNV15844.1 hypothetical protein FIC94_11190 [[Ochrobactrum] teleogrylli]